MKRIMITACTAAVLMLVSQAALAETRVFVSVGIPAVQVRMTGGSPCGDSVWIEGYYRHERPRYVWVPGHWESARRHHAVYVPKPPARPHHRQPAYYHHGHENGCGHPGRDVRGRGHDGYDDRENMREKKQGNGNGKHDQGRWVYHQASNW